MDKLKEFLNNKPIYLPDQGPIRDFNDYINVDVPADVQECIKSINPNNQGLIQVVEKPVQVQIDFPTCFHRSNLNFALATKNNTVYIFDAAKPQMFLQQLQLNQKVTQIILIDDPLTIIMILNNQVVSIYMKSGLMGKIKEVNQVKEHKDQLCCIHLLPNYTNDAGKQVISILSSDRTGCVQLSRNVTDHMITQRVIKLSEAALCISSIRIPVRLRDDNGLLGQLDENSQSFTTIVSVQTQSKILFFVEKVTDERVQMIQIGETQKAKTHESVEKNFNVSNNFYYNKIDNDIILMSVFSFENQVQIIRIENIKEGQAIKKLSIVQISMQENLLRDNKIIQVQMLNERQMLVLLIDCYYIVDCQKFNEPEDQYLIQRSEHKQTLQGISNNQYCSMHNGKTLNVLFYDLENQRAVVVEFNQQTVNQRIDSLQQSQPLCSFELLVQEGIRKHTNFRNHSEVLLSFTEKAKQLIHDSKSIQCIILETQSKLCLQVLLNQFKPDSYLAQFLLLAESYELLRDPFVEGVANYIIGACIYTSMCYNGINQMLINWKLNQPVQNYMKELLITQLVVQISKYQVPLQATVYNFLFKQLQVMERNQQYHQVLSYLTLNCYHCKDFEQLMVLIENNKFYQVIPAIFLDLLNRDDIQLKSGATIHEYCYKMFMKWVLMNLKQGRGPLDQKMMEAFSILFQIILGNNRSIVQRRFLGGLVIDTQQLAMISRDVGIASATGQVAEEQLEEIKERCKGLNLIQECFTFDVGDTTVTKRMLDPSLVPDHQEYFLPLYSNEQSLLLLHNGTAYDYFKRKHYQQFLEYFYINNVQSPVNIKDQTQLFTIYNIVDSVGQYRTYKCLIYNVQLIDTYQNVHTQILNNLYYQTFLQQDLQPKMSPKAAYIGLIIAHLLIVTTNQNNYQYINQVQQNFNQINYSASDNFDDSLFQQFELDDIQKLLLIKINDKQQYFLCNCVFTFQQTNEQIMRNRCYDDTDIKQWIQKSQFKQQFKYSSVAIAYQLPCILVLKELLKYLEREGRLSADVEHLLNIKDYIYFILCVLQISLVDHQYLGRQIQQLIESNDFTESFNHDEQMCLRMIMHDLLGDHSNAVQCLKSLSPVLTIRYLQSFETFSRCLYRIARQTGAHDNIMQCYKGQLLLQQCFADIYDGIHSETAEDQNDVQMGLQENSFSLLRLLVSLYKYNPADCYQLLLQDAKYEELLFQFLCVILDPGYLTNNYDTAKDYAGLNSLIRKNVSYVNKTDPGLLEMVFTSYQLVSNPISPKENAKTYLLPLLRTLCKFMAHQQLIELLRRIKTVLQLDQNGEIISRFISENTEYIQYGMYLLQLTNQHDKLRRLLQVTFQQLSTERPQDLVDYITNCIERHMQERLSEQNRGQLSQFLVIANRIEDQEIRHTVLTKLAEVYQKLMDINELCQMFMELYRNTTWSEAHKLLDGIIHQLDISSDMRREEVNVASLDLQSCCLHESKYLRQGVVSNTGTCCMCSRYAQEKTDQVHSVVQQLEDGATVELRTAEQKSGYYIFGCGHCCHHQCLDETPASRRVRYQAIERLLAGEPADQVIYTAEREVKCPECK